jgi:hypothetical protein
MQPARAHANNPRTAQRTGKGRVRVYETYAVSLKKRGGEITLSFTSPEKDFFIFIFMKSLHGEFF